MKTQKLTSKVKANIASSKAPPTRLPNRKLAPPPPPRVWSYIEKLSQTLHALHIGPHWAG